LLFFDVGGEQGKLSLGLDLRPRVSHALGLACIYLPEGLGKLDEWFDETKIRNMKYWHSLMDFPSSYVKIKSHSARCRGFPFRSGWWIVLAPWSMSYDFSSRGTLTTPIRSNLNYRGPQISFWQAIRKYLFLISSCWGHQSFQI
jgi:hypothetical protein